MDDLEYGEAPEVGCIVSSLLGCLVCSLFLVGHFSYLCLVVCAQVPEARMRALTKELQEKRDRKSKFHRHRPDYEEDEVLAINACVSDLLSFRVFLSFSYHRCALLFLL